MKKVVLVIIIFMLCACSKQENKEEVNSIKSPLEINTPQYKDLNPVKISLYVDNSVGGLDKVKDEYHSLWQRKKDIVVFGSLFCEDDFKDPDYFQNIWYSCANNYENYNLYKVGWQVEFELTNGQEIKQVITKPSDVNSFYDYLEIYLYDSYNVPINTWYSHLTDEQIDEDTILTSMKLTAGSLFTQIKSEITVSVFTYDDKEDFDENGFYRGNSVSKVKVYND